MSIKIDYVQAIRENYDRLGKKKQKIADILLKSPSLFLEKNLSELAQLCQCEQTAIIRFAQQLKYSGFSELKLAIARQSNIAWQDFAEDGLENVQSEGDHFRILCNKLIKLRTESMQKTLDGIDEAVINQLVEKLNHSQQIMLAGAGTSGLAALDLYIKFSRIGVKSYYFEDFELQKTFIGYLGEKDILFLFSNSGKTENIVKLAQLAHSHKISVCAITSDAESPLAKLATYLLLTHANEHQFRLGSMVARSAQLIIGDLICLKFSLSDKQRSWDYLEKSYEGIL